MNHHPPHRHPSLLPYLPAYRLFNPLRRLAKPGQRGIPILRPSLLPSKHNPLPIRRHNSHDHRGVRARETQVGYARSGDAVGARGGWFGRGGAADGAAGHVGGVGGGAHPFAACVDGDCGLAAGGAEGVAGVPVEEGAGLGVDGGCRGGIC